MGGGDDPSAGEAEPDADRGEPDPAALWTARTTWAPRWRLGPKSEQAGFFDQPFTKVALEFTTGSRAGTKCLPEPAQGGAEHG